MDVTDLDTETEFDPVEALTKAWTTEDAPPEREELSEADEDTNAQPTDKHADEDPETPDEEVQGDEESEDSEKGAEDEKAYVESDDVFVKVKVDGEEREFAIKDLKRLAGQEAALTRKSQEVAEVRKAVDTANEANAARVQGLLNRALERWKPYENVNLLVAAKSLEPEQLQALQSDMQARWDDIQFLSQEHDALTKDIHQTRHNDLVKAAQECIKTLSDPEKGIEGWNEQMYADLCGFAKEQGISKDLINNLTDPSAFKIIRDAMLYRKGLNRVQTGKDRAAKPNKGKAPPKKIVKGTVNADATRAVVKPSKSQDAIKKLRDTGSRDDAVDAMMALWGDGSND